MKKYIFITISMLLMLSFSTTLQAGDRSIIKIGDDIYVEKDMRVDDAVSVGGSVHVEGIVEGDAVAIGGTIYLGEEAIVHGDVVTVGGALEQTDGSMIYGTVVDIGSFDLKNIFKNSHFYDGPRMIPRVLRIIPLIGVIALVFLFAVLIPKELGSVVINIKNEPIVMFLYGLLGIILIIPLALMLIISIIGIALIPLEILAIFLATLIGYIAVAIMVGKKIFKVFNKEQPAILLSAILGIFILWLVGLIPIFGCLVKWIAAVTGFGAVIITVARRNKKSDEITIETESVEAK